MSDNKSKKKLVNDVNGKIDNKNILSKSNVNWNFFTAMMNISASGYGSKHDFVQNKIDDCLRDGIISIEASKNDFWSRYNIEIQDQAQVEMHNPYKLMRYTDGDPEEKLFWKFKFKKVILPIGWYLQKEFSYNYEMKSFNFCVFNSNNELVETICYYSNLYYN